MGLNHNPTITSHAMNGLYMIKYDGDPAILHLAPVA